MNPTATPNTTSASTPTPPTTTAPNNLHIGIIGSGQLARMLAQAGQPLGATFAFAADPGADNSPVAGLGDLVALADYEDPSALYAAMGKPAVITVEKEHVHTPLLEALTAFCRVAPNPKAVFVTQHRTREKTFLNNLNIPTVGFAQATDRESLIAGVQQIGYPVILKSEEAGYDGKNQWRLQTAADLEQFCTHYDSNPIDLVIEQWVQFEAEVSMVAARGIDGQKSFYALTENRHQNGILLTSRAPAPHGSDALTLKATNYLNNILDALDYVGILAMECFIVGDQLLVNELAPRVHNSGHWTQQGCQASQFENHVRAIAGLPLGPVAPLGQAGMLNLLGIQAHTDALASPDASRCATLHWYDKACKPGRKVGHINIQDNKADTVDTLLTTLEQLHYPAQS